MVANTVLKAKGIWKGHGDAKESYRWILKEVNLEVREGEFISLLGEPVAGKSTLLNILGFRELPDRGEVYFQGRLVGEFGGKELEYMRKEKVWLVNNSLPAQTPPRNLAAILLDRPAGLFIKPGPENYLLSHIRCYNQRGISVVIATRDPSEASCATSIYKLKEGRIVNLNGNAR